MSLVASSWSWTVRDIRPMDKFVLISLANRAGTESSKAWPSVGRIADDTGICRKTVLTCLQRLQQSGLIVDTGERKGRTKSVKVFKLLVDSATKIFDSTESKTEKKPDSASAKPFTMPAMPSAKAAQNPIDVATLPLPDCVKPEDWQMWVDYRAEAGKKLTATSAKLQLRSLNAWAEKGHEPKTIIEKSIERGWMGLFEPPPSFTSVSACAAKPSGADEAFDRMIRKQKALDTAELKTRQEVGYRCRCQLPDNQARALFAKTLNGYKAKQQQGEFAAEIEAEKPAPAQPDPAPLVGTFVDSNQFFDADSFFDDMDLDAMDASFDKVLGRLSADERYALEADAAHFEAEREVDFTRVMEHEMERTLLKKERANPPEVVINPKNSAFVNRLAKIGAMRFGCNHV